MQNITILDTVVFSLGKVQVTIMMMYYIGFILAGGYCTYQATRKLLRNNYRMAIFGYIGSTFAVSCACFLNYITSVSFQFNIDYIIRISIMPILIACLGLIIAFAKTQKIESQNIQEINVDGLILKKPLEEEFIPEEKKKAEYDEIERIRERVRMQNKK